MKRCACNWKRICLSDKKREGADGGGGEKGEGEGEEEGGRGGSAPKISKCQPTSKF